MPCVRSSVPALLRVLLLVTLVVGGCKRTMRREGGGGPRAAADAGAATLYERIGGAHGLERLVDEVWLSVMEDERINGRFEGTETQRFRLGLQAFLCVSLGGTCPPQGRNLRDIHAGIGITRSELGAWLEDVERAMVRREITERDRVDIMAALRSAGDQVVEHPQ